MFRFLNPQVPFSLWGLPLPIIDNRLRGKDHSTLFTKKVGVISS